MKSSFSGIFAILLLASCSAPKYSYYFDHYDYNAGKRKKAAVENSVAAQSAPVEITSEPVNAPQPEEGIVLASVKKEVLLLKEAKIARSEKRTVRTLTKVERKQLVKQVKLEVKKYKKETKDHAKDAAGGDKNQLVALLLAIFLGGLGIHRFYLGRIGTGIAQLLLLVFGFLLVPLYILAVWVLIDIILIALGELGPKNGVYNPKL